MNSMLSSQEYIALEVERAKRIQDSNHREQEVGIWWDDGTSLVILSDPISKSENSVRWFNGTWDHWRAWPAVAHIYEKHTEDEYCSVPRGRVVYDVKLKVAIIYHGTKATKKRLSLVVQEFQLINWQTALDEHYEEHAPEHEFEDHSDDHSFDPLI